MKPVDTTLLLNALIMGVSGLISFVLWRVQRTQLLRTLTTIWLCLVVCGVLQVVAQGGTLITVLGGACTYPGYYLMADLLAVLAKVNLKRARPHVAFAVAMLCAFAAYGAGLSFVWVALPMTIGVCYPMLVAAVSALANRSATITVKLLAAVTVLVVLHNLDYPFLRFNESFAPIGFTIATALVFAFGVLAPLAIIEYQRDEFAALASHELKTPITALLFSANLLSDEVENAERKGISSVQQLRRIAASTDRQVQYLNRIVSNLLSVSHLRAGLFQLRPEDDIDLCALAAEVAERLEMTFHDSSESGRRIRVKRIEAMGPGPKGRWDRFKIDLVITNLLTNALKYGDGKPIQLEVGGTESGATVVVRDEGIGIDVASQARLFRPYQRGANAKDIAGLGLGLYVSRQIVQMHGGELRFESSPGLGTTFIMTLPMTI